MRARASSLLVAAVLLCLSAAAAPRRSEDPICGASNLPILLSPYPRPHLTNVPSEAQCYMSWREGYPEAAKVHIAGPKTTSPFRSGGLGGGIAELVSEFLGFLRLDLPSPSDVVASVKKVLAAWRLADFFWTFGTPSALRRILSTQRVTFTMQYRRQGHGGADDGPITIFAIDPASPSTRRVVCPKESATFVPASWKRWWQGEELTVSLLPDSTIVEQCVATVPAVCSAEFLLAMHRPVATPASYLGSDPEVTISVSEDWDMWVLRMSLAFLAIRILAPHLVQSTVLQLLVTFLFGFLVIAAILLYFVLRDMQKSWIGRVGIITVFGVGGAAAVVEGLLSAALAFFLRELQSSFVFQVITLSAGVIAATVTHYYFRAQLPIATWFVLRVAQVVICAWMGWQNPEVVFALCWMWLGLAVFVRLAHLQMPSFAGEGPKDSFPKTAYEAKGYVHTNAQRIVGRDANERFKKYEREGNDYTRRQLEHLAETVRTHPEYAKLVRNPNELYRFAGTD